MTDASTRYPTLSTVQGYLGQGIDGVFGVDGSPPGRIVVEAHRGVLGVRVPADGHAPDMTEFENLTLSVVEDDGLMWHQISVHLEGNLDEVYAVLCGVLDRVQLQGQRFAEAVADVLGSLQEILAVRHGLALERRIGLFGELLVLVAIVDDLGPSDAVASWRGPLGEEHDFGLTLVDLEVKATLSERREHWISSLTQLVPTGDRPLDLVSVQLTTAALDSGWTLPALVAQARGAAGSASAQLESALRSVGYRDEDADLYRSRWTLRTPPAFFRVDSDFPALTAAGLATVVPNAHRVTDVRYRVDLSSMNQVSAVVSFGSIVDARD
jgi:hypothetical protein